MKLPLFQGPREKVKGPKVLKRTQPQGSKISSTSCIDKYRYSMLSALITCNWQASMPVTTVDLEACYK